jgi:hypothetical protein
MNNDWRSIRAFPCIRKQEKIRVMDRSKKSHGGFTIEKIEWLPTNAAKPEPSMPVWVRGVVTSLGIPKTSKEQIFAERQTAYTNVHKIFDGTPL